MGRLDFAASARALAGSLCCVLGQVIYRSSDNKSAEQGLILGIISKNFLVNCLPTQGLSAYDATCPREVASP